MTADPVWQIVIGIVAALFIGFGGELGILVTPLAALVYPSHEAIGIVLPLLIVADIFSIFFTGANGMRVTFAGFCQGLLSGSSSASSLSEDWMITGSDS